MRTPKQLAHIERLKSFGGHNLKDLSGKKFGRLRVLRLYSHGTNNIPARWLCKCICGTVKDISSRNLLTGDSKSCGCLNREITSLRSKTHGMSNNRTYKLWAGMLSRCRNNKGWDSKYYHHKGITVCKDWLRFENFIADMGEVPNGMEIDRIDNNKGYYLKNCHYVTHKINCRNSSRNRLIKFKGIVKPMCEWADDYNIPVERLRHRLNRGWTVTKALKTPRLKDGDATKRSQIGRQTASSWGIPLKYFQKGGYFEKILWRLQKQNREV